MYIMISTARPAQTMADVLDDLAMSVSQTVRWRDVTGVLAERGTRFVLQLPPGRVPVRLAESDEESRGDSRVDVRAMSDTGLADSAFLVRRAAGKTRLRLRRNRASVRADAIDFSERMRLTASAVTDPGAAVAPVATRWSADASVIAAAERLGATHGFRAVVRPCRSRRRSVGCGRAGP